MNAARSSTKDAEVTSIPISLYAQPLHLHHVTEAKRQGVACPHIVDACVKSLSRLNQSTPGRLFQMTSLTKSWT